VTGVRGQVELGTRNVEKCPHLHSEVRAVEPKCLYWVGYEIQDEECRNAVFWDAMSSGSCMNRYFGEKCISCLLLLTLYLARRASTLMMEAIRSSETSVLTIGTRHHIPEDGILNSDRRENLKSYITLAGWDLYRRRNVFPVRYELGFISQKTTFFIVTAVKTSNLTR
jgi:hypothetical protein